MMINIYYLIKKAYYNIYYIWLIHYTKKTYKFVKKNDHEAIKCLVCGLISCNSDDIKHKFCGFCRMFHESHYLVRKQIIDNNKEKIWKLKQKQN